MALETGITALELRLRALESQGKANPSNPAIALATNLNDIGYLQSYHASLAGDYTLTTSEADVGVSFTIDVAGDYILWGVFDISVVSDNGVVVTGYCTVGGTNRPEQAIFQADVDERCTVAQVWYATGILPGTIVKLRAKKAAGSGTSAVKATHTVLRALNIG